MDATTDEIASCSSYYEGTFAKRTYVNLLLVPIYIIVALCYFITFIITLLRLFLWTKEWKFAKKFREADRKMIAYMLEGFFNMLHHREGIRELENENVVIHHTDFPTKEIMEMSELGGAISNSDKFDNKAEISQSTMIDTQEILRSKLAMTILGWYIANISSLALVVFWDVFIINETHGCNDEFDCFFRNGTYISQSCSCLSNEEYFSAQCFEVSLEFPKAIAEVAGLLFLAFNGFAFLMFLKLLVADGIASQCFRIVIYILLAVIEYSVVFGIIGAFVARAVVLEKEDSTNVIIEEVLISIALLMGVTAPWMMLLWAFKKVVRRKNASTATKSEAN